MASEQDARGETERGIAVPEEWKENLRDRVVTSDMLEAALFKANKEAKNARDGRGYASMDEMYGLKDRLLNAAEEEYGKETGPHVCHLESYEFAVRAVRDDSSEYAENRGDFYGTKTEWSNRLGRNVSYGLIVEKEPVSARAYYYRDLGNREDWHSYHRPIMGYEWTKERLEAETGLPVREISLLHTHGADPDTLVPLSFCEELVGIMTDGEGFTYAGPEDRFVNIVKHEDHYTERDCDKVNESLDWYADEDGFTLTREFTLETRSEALSALPGELYDALRNMEPGYTACSIALDLVISGATDPAEIVGMLERMEGPELVDALKIVGFDAEADRALPPDRAEIAKACFREMPDCAGIILDAAEHGADLGNVMSCIREYGLRNTHAERLTDGILAEISDVYGKGASEDGMLCLLNYVGRPFPPDAEDFRVVKEMIALGAPSEVAASVFEATGDDLRTLAAYITADGPDRAKQRALRLFGSAMEFSPGGDRSDGIVARAAWANAGGSERELHDLIGMTHTNDWAHPVTYERAFADMKEAGADPRTIRTVARMAGNEWDENMARNIADAYGELAGSGAPPELIAECAGKRLDFPAIYAIADHLHDGAADRLAGRLDDVRAAMDAFEPPVSSARKESERMASVPPDGGYGLSLTEHSDMGLLLLARGRGADPDALGTLQRLLSGEQSGDCGVKEQIFLEWQEWYNECSELPDGYADADGAAETGNVISEEAITGILSWIADGAEWASAQDAMEDSGYGQTETDPGEAVDTDTDSPDADGQSADSQSAGPVGGDDEEDCWDTVGF